MNYRKFYLITECGMPFGCITSVKDLSGNILYESDDCLCTRDASVEDAKNWVDKIYIALDLDQSRELK